MRLLEKTIAMIEDLDREIMKKARNRVDNLIKPPNSLGKLEDIAVQLAGIKKSIQPKVDKKTLIAMAADHGVYEEGVAGYPQEITVIQTLNMAKGLTGVCALGRVSNTKIVPVDIGVKVDFDDDSGIINKKIRYGTNNMTKGPAMTRDEAIRAIEVGIEVTNEEIKKGANLIGTGEMGVTNTTASTAILSVLGNIDPAEITGRGAKLCDEGINRKIKAIKTAIKINNIDPNDPIDVVSKVGGLEIAGMSGIILSAAANNVPVVIDGYISTISALIAFRLQPKAKKYIIPSHASLENGAKKASELLGVEPIINMNLCLGEGSGAVLTFPIIDAACEMINNMPTFEELGMTI